MRKLLLGSAAITFSTVLSGCSFLGIGGHSNGHHTGNHYGNSHHASNVAPKSCGTSQCLSRWNLEGGIGAAFPVDGNIVTGGRTNAGTGQAIRNISYNDAYDTGYRAELGGSYALSPNRKITATGFFEEADSAGTLDWGTVNGEQLTGALSDYRSYGAELGLRQYFRPRRGLILNSVRPYVEGRAGVARTDDISVEGAQLGGVAVAAAPIPFYDDSWSATAAGLVGVETPLTRYSTIGLETGLRYQHDLKSDTSVAVPGTALAGTNNANGRLSVPLMLRGRYRF